MVFTSRLILLSAVLVVSSCESEPVKPDGPEYSYAWLMAVPETIGVDQYQLTLSSSISRDFMPISPPDGKPMAGIVYVNAINVDSITMPLDIDSIWLLHEGELCNLGFTTDRDVLWDQKPNQLKRIFRDGPKWGPDIYIDVVVRVIDKNEVMHLLRASNQYVGMTS